jgi:hypothetical protein
MATLAQVRAAARRKYGKRCGIETNRYALTPEKRRDAAARRTWLCETIRSLDDKIKFEGGDEKVLIALCRAARFVTDTDGDNAAILELLGKVTWADDYLGMKHDRREYVKERDSLTGKVFSRKYQVVVVDAMIPDWPIRRIEHEADTLDGLLALIDGAKKPVTV